METIAESGLQDSELDDWQKQEDSDDLFQSSLFPLSKQAREVLMASAYDEATPEELAVRFGMNKSNVYNILSRARIKANDERFHQEVARFLQDRRRSKQTVSGLLPAPVYSSPYG
jgi:DNA-directed RNA polymerase specialized sigma24 family protein